MIVQARLSEKVGSERTREGKFVDELTGIKGRYTRHRVQGDSLSDLWLRSIDFTIDDMRSVLVDDTASPLASIPA